MGAAPVWNWYNSGLSLIKPMGSHETTKADPAEELPDEWWHKIYGAVMVTTVVVISALWAFSRYFSS